MIKRIAVLATLALAGCMQGQVITVGGPETAGFGVKCTLVNNFGTWHLDPPSRVNVVVAGDMHIDCIKPGLASWHSVLQPPYTTNSKMWVVRDGGAP